MKQEESGQDKPQENQAVTSYDEDAFNAMVDADDDTEIEVDPELSDHQTGAKDDDGNADISADANLNDEPQQEPASTDEGDKGEPENARKVPDWIDKLPEDDKEQALNELLRLETEVDRIQARYESQTGQLKPTQRKVAKLEELVRRYSAAAQPGKDHEKRGAELEAWIEKHGEDFPAEANELRQAFTAYKSSVKELESDAERYREARADTDDYNVDRTIQRRLLERIDDNAAQISVDPRFQHYLNSHPELAQQAQSPFAHDVVEVLDAFRKDTQWQPPMFSDDFITVNQMLTSPIFASWSNAIGLTAEHVQGQDSYGQAKILHHFKVDLDQAHRANGENSTDDNVSGNEASKLAARRNRQRKDYSPAPRKTGTGGGKTGALTGEEYFDSLDLDD